MVEKDKKIKVGPGLLPDTEMGPLVAKSHMEKVLAYIFNLRASAKVELYNFSKRYGTVIANAFLFRKTEENPRS